MLRVLLPGRYKTANVYSDEAHIKTIILGCFRTEGNLCLVPGAPCPQVAMGFADRRRGRREHMATRKSIRSSTSICTHRQASMTFGRLRVTGTLLTYISSVEVALLGCRKGIV